jgi:transposase InsO family protein
MHRELVAQGYACSENRIARVMRAERIRAKQRRRFRVTTNSAHAAPTAPNILARRFTVRPSAGLNAIWVADVTFIPTREAWVYLAVVLDLHSRRVVGWGMQSSLTWDLVRDALGMAIVHRRPPAGLLHHSDRGLQYACENYRTLLQRHRMIASMSRAGDCWDNAVAESFFATLKSELVSDATWATRAEAQRALFRYIEMWYNRRRRHSSLGYLSPADFERTVSATV